MTSLLTAPPLRFLVANLGSGRDKVLIRFEAIACPSFLPPAAMASREREREMFPGMFARKPDKEVALKQLRSHVAMFGAWVVVVRAAPYILHYFSDRNEQLTLDI